MNKRGISNVVTFVLIILIFFTSILIIWNFFNHSSKSDLIHESSNLVANNSNVQGYSNSSYSPKPSSSSKSASPKPSSSQSSSQSSTSETNQNSPNIQAFLITGSSINGVENVAALVSLSTSNLTDGTSFPLFGYYTRGDGGGGMVYYDANSVEVPNGGTVFSPVNASKGRFKRVITGSSFYVDWFGAKGDGVSDDLGAIQSAIDSVGRGTLIFGAKDYVISSFLSISPNNNYITLTGGGPRSTRLIVKGAGTDGIHISGSDDHTSTSFVTLSNMFIYHPDSPAGGIGLLLENSALAHVYDFNIDGFATGVKMHHATNTQLERVLVTLTMDVTKFVGFRIDGEGWQGSVSSVCRECYVDASGAKNTPSFGFYIDGKWVQDLLLDDISTASANYGIYIDGTKADSTFDIHIRDPIVDWFDQTGIFLVNLKDTSHVSISGGWIDAKPSTETHGVYISNSRGVEITGAQFFGSSLNPVIRGIEVHDSKNIIISNNLFTFQDHGIILSNSNLSSITGNRFYSPSNKVSTADITLDNSHRNTISSNILDGYSSAGVAVDSKSYNNIITANNINPSNIPSPMVASSANNFVNNNIFT